MSQHLPDHSYQTQMLRHIPGQPEMREEMVLSFASNMTSFRALTPDVSTHARPLISNTHPSSDTWTARDESGNGSLLCLQHDILQSIDTRCVNTCQTTHIKHKCL